MSKHDRVIELIRALKPRDGGFQRMITMALLDNCHVCRVSLKEGDTIYLKRGRSNSPIGIQGEKGMKGTKRYHLQCAQKVNLL